MTATYYSNGMDGGQNEPSTIEVAPAIFDRVYELITPTAAMDRGWRKDHMPLVARMTLKYPDGTQREVFVRWTGKNPAAVSLDDETFFWADASNVGDGANALAGLLLGLRKH